MVKSPDAAIGSPSSTASCAPGGRNGGAGPYFTRSRVKAFCAWDGCAANSAARERATARNGSFIEPLQTGAHDNHSSPEQQAAIDWRRRLFRHSCSRKLKL